MEKIALPRGVWFYDPAKRLGEKGGFGSVYEGQADGYGNLAIKRLHLSASGAAHREMRIAAELAGRPLTNVMQVFDAGEDPGSGAYFLVMPRADKSLHQEIDSGKRFSEEETAKILLGVTDGLLEVSDIVHRDLKPANILFHEGRWKVADFGIARFVEEATSLRTLKGCLSPLYASPEQWQYIRATSATDVYALGCIGYALLTGKPPFTADTEEELREQHLHADPPQLPCSGRLRSILTMMLRKPSDARPDLARVRTVLDDFACRPPEPSSVGFGALADAGADVARAEAAEERQRQAEMSVSTTRGQLAATGKGILREVIVRLLERILKEAPAAKRKHTAVSLGRGILEFSLSEKINYRDTYVLPANAFARSKWDVVVGEEIVVRQQQPEYRWSATLWYARLPETAGYRWYEASYFALRGDAMAPYSLAGKIEDADLAASMVMHVYQLAFGPTPIDDENEQDFAERWAAILARASRGELRHPSNLPLRPDFWKHQW